MEDLEDFWKIDPPPALTKVLDNLSPDERAEIVAAKATENFPAVVDLMNAKFSTLPHEEEAEILEYFDRKNCAELGIPYRRGSY
jgi:hypothetical protein